MKGALAVRGIVKRYGAHAAVDGVSLDVRAGAMVALLGPSGCGKTTLLRCIAGLAEPDAGEVSIDGAPITGLPPWRRELGMVFQSYALFPHLSVAANVGFGLRMRGLDRAATRERVERALSLVQMEAFADRRPRQLSGGQQQRVALARALVTEPPVLLLDEPLSALDAKLRLAMRQELRELQRRLGTTTIVVTHDQDEAMAMADEVAVMNRGRLEQIGPPEAIYREPATAFVAEFVGRSNRFEGVVDRDGRLVVDGFAQPLALPRTAVAGRALAIVRPEHVALSTSGPGLAGEVRDVVFAGDHVDVHVAIGDLRIVAQTASPPAIGTRVAVSWSLDALRVWSLRRSDPGSG